MNKGINKELMAAIDEKGTLRHDYSNELHYNHAMDSLGGAEFLKAEYPLVFQLFENTRQIHIMAGVNNTATVDVAPQGFSDSTSINYISYDDKTITSKMRADLTDTKPTIAIAGRLIDKTDHDRVVGTTNVYVEDDYQLDGLIAKPSSEISSGDNKEFSTLTDFYWMNVDENGNPVLVSHSSMYSDLKMVGTKNIVTNFVINDPVIKQTTTRDYVQIVYQRTAQVGEDYDYDYPNVQFTQSGHTYVKIYIPVSGTVTVDNEFDVVGLNPDMGFVLRIEDINKGVINYYQNFASITQTIAADKKSITWKFQDDWNNYIDRTYFGVRTRVNFYNQMEIKLTHVKTGMPVNVTVVMDSKAKPGLDKSIVVAKTIDIYWGCLGKDTKVFMADGSFKLISDIQVGDMVMNDQKQPIQVLDIYTGPENDMILVETVSGMKVLASAGHPVVTSRGSIQAQDLTADDTVMTINGYEALSNLRTVSYNDTVYNLKFAEESNIICDGIIVGDFGMQQSIEDSKKEPEPIVYSDAVNNTRNEFRKLFESLNAN